MMLPHRAPSNAQSQDPPDQKDGGIGGKCIENPRLAASELRLYRMAIRRRWKIPDRILEQLPDEAERLMRETDDDRVKLGAMNTIMAMHTHNQQMDLAEDKLDRLDNNQATENVATVQYIKGIDEGDV